DALSLTKFELMELIDVGVDRIAESHELEAYPSLLSQYKGSRSSAIPKKVEALEGMHVLRCFFHGGKNDTRGLRFLLHSVVHVISSSGYGVQVTKSTRD
ncbi:hypothetical protein Tco_1249017, partial [Tanacetum coccineum]